MTSISLDHLKGLAESKHWPNFVKDGGNYQINLSEGVEEATLDELSKADLSILENLWKRFAEFSGYQLRDWTHQNCPEWEDPKGSSKSISHSQVFKFLKKEDAVGLDEDVQEYRKFFSALDAC